MNKDRYLHIRMDDKTWQLLSDAAAREQNTDTPNISKYVRALIGKTSHGVTDDLVSAIHALENQIIRIGNNINQIARSANMGLITEEQKIRLMEYMDEVIKKEEQLLTEIYSQRM